MLCGGCQPCCIHSVPVELRKLIKADNYYKVNLEELNNVKQRLRWKYSEKTVYSLSFLNNREASKSYISTLNSIFFHSKNLFHTEGIHQVKSCPSKKCQYEILIRHGDMSPQCLGSYLRPQIRLHWSALFLLEKKKTQNKILSCSNPNIYSAITSPVEIRAAFSRNQ